MGGWNSLIEFFSPERIAFLLNLLDSITCLRTLPATKPLVFQYFRFSTHRHKRNATKTEMKKKKKKRKQYAVY